MLYDPKWEKSQPDLVYKGVSLRGLIAWLETKNPEETYCFLISSNCLVTQYAKAVGLDWQQLRTLPDYNPRKKSAEGEWLTRIALADGHPPIKFFWWKFGQALATARKILAQVEKDAALKVAA